MNMIVGSAIMYLLLNLCEVSDRFKAISRVLDEICCRYLETVFSNWACLNASFLQTDDSHYCCSSRHHGVNLSEASDGFKAISRIEHETLKDLVSQHPFLCLPLINRHEIQ